MPRPPSKHGLEKKFKPWRKGKSSAAAKKKSCPKNQLRGQVRLLAKFESNSDPDKRKELEESIFALNKEIADKAGIEKQRQHAQQSHGVRFLERQRLFRMEKAVRKLLDDTRDANEQSRYQQELSRIALDQVYVAHFPHDQKYAPLFRKGVRAIDDKRALSRRVLTRSRILRELKKGDLVEWISQDQYERLPKQEWTIEMETETFGVQEPTVVNLLGASDKRFALSSQQANLVEKAQQLESSIAKEIIQKNDSKYDGCDSDEESNYDSDKGIDHETSTTGNQPVTPVGASSEGSNSDRSSDSSDDSSDSSDDSSDDDEENTKIGDTTTKRQIEKVIPADVEDDDEFDDFLMVANEKNNTVDVFKQAKQDKTSRDFISGDKSKGWKTQRQKPGEFKKPRVRK